MGAYGSCFVTHGPEVNVPLGSLLSLEGLTP